MASSFKTPNYLLPQFVEEDTPKWLEDINPAFSTLDEKLKEINNSIPDMKKYATTNQIQQLFSFRSEYFSYATHELDYNRGEKISNDNIQDTLQFNTNNIASLIMISGSLIINMGYNINVPSDSHKRFYYTYTKPKTETMLDKLNPYTYFNATIYCLDENRIVKWITAYNCFFNGGTDNLNIEFWLRPTESINGIRYIILIPHTELIVNSNSVGYTFLEPEVKIGDDMTNIMGEMGIQTLNEPEPLLLFDFNERNDK